MLAVMEQIDLREIPNFYDMENTVKADGKLDLAALCSFLTEKVRIAVWISRKGNAGRQDSAALHLRAVSRHREYAMARVCNTQRRSRSKPSSRRMWGRCRRRSSRKRRKCSKRTATFCPPK